MRYLKTYRIFESAGSGLTQEQEEFMNEWTEGSWTYNSKTGLVDVKGDFWCKGEKLKSLAGIKFGKVSGYFDCSRNNLTSLEGAPQEVGRSFRCKGNKLTSLEGAPQEVGGDFYCTENRLTSLEGAPQKVGGDFYCTENRLTSLEGAPQKVGGSFYCSENRLTSLEGSPQEVGGNFYCRNNQLTTLEGAPREVGGNFWCSSNQLTTLEGAPREVRKDFDCSNNKLTSLEGAPQKVGGGFICRNNPVSAETLYRIFGVMKKGKGYLEAVVSSWSKIPVDDQALLLRPEVLNKQIKQDPAGMIMKLKSVWNSPEFKDTKSKLVWPRGYEEEMDIVSGLNNIGF
jgi:hypothetical protein